MDRHSGKRRLARGDRRLSRTLAVLLVTSSAIAVPVSAVVAQNTSAVGRSDPYLWLQLTFSPWAKICNKDVRAKRTCITFANGQAEDGVTAVSAAVIEVEGELRQFLRFRILHDVALQHGTRLLVDQAPPAVAPFVRCLPPAVQPGGCLSDHEGTAEVIGRMKSGRFLTLQAINPSGQMVGAQIELKGFAQAYEGPGAEPFAEQQKKFEGELGKREPRPRLNN